jgi:hypothetical protein
MTVSATVLKSDDFESGSFGAGWTAPGESIVDGTTGVTDADSPMVGSTDLKLVQLDTEGGIWTNTVSESFATTNIFTDMLVKFVPSEELPVIGTDVKLAVAVLAGTPNVLAISVIDQSEYNTNAWIITEGEIDTNAWTRLTIELGNVGGYAFANIKTNGVLVNASPYYVNESDKTLNSIGFQGTGFIDEVVVRDDDPIGGATYFGTTENEVDPAELAAWKTAYSVGTEENGQYEAFLMNVAPDGSGSPALKVTSITVGATEVTVTIIAEYADTSTQAINLGALNNGAAAAVYGEASLEGATWTTPITGSDDLVFEPGTSLFYKVKIQ